jgi:predicted MFS family arabinose efflux permease
MATSIAVADGAEEPAEAVPSLWRDGEFNKLWAGQSISVLGTGLTQVALPLTAILSLHASPAQLGYLGASQLLPSLLLAIFAGVLADRIERRKQMIAADVGRALALASIPLLSFTGHLTMHAIYAIAAVTGALTVVFDVAYGAYVPSLLRREHIVAGNSRLQGSASAGEIVGSALGGALVSLFRPAAVLLGDAISFLVSAFSIALIRRPEPDLGRPEATGSVLAEVRKDLREGVSFMSRHAILRPLALNALTVNFLTMMLLTLFPLYVLRTVHLSPLWLGVIYAAGGAGGVAGATLTSFFVGRAGFGRMLLGSMAIFRVGVIAIPFIRGPEWVAGPLLMTAQFLALFGVLSSNIMQASLKQMVTPDRLQGRVSGAFRIFMEGFVPIAAVVAGWLGTAIGVQETLWLTAVGFPLTFLIVVLSPLRHSTSLDEIAKGDDEDGEAGQAEQPAAEPATATA